MLLRETALADAIVVAERLRATVAAQPLQLRELKLPLTISIGVAEVGPSRSDTAALLRAADEQLYRAKQGGRNRVSPASA